MSNTKFEVGGCVRDGFMDIASKDVDFSVVMDGEFATADEAFQAMHDELEAEGFIIFEVTPDKFTIRAKVPDEMVELRARTDVADFVLARTDGPSSDGRHPDWVKAADLRADLDRRDFTVNAIAVDPTTGEFIDPHNGREDIENRILRFVGDPMQRINEDGLRSIRGLRFMVTKGFTPTESTWEAINSDLAVERMAAVSDERVQVELGKMLAFDTCATMILFTKVNPDLIARIFGGRVRFAVTSTMKKGSRR